MAEMVEERLKNESAVFHYEAADDRGRVITGTTDAETSAGAIRRRLESKGYRVTVVKRGPSVPEEHPDEAIKRVAQTVLEQGLKDEAREIRIALPRGGGGDKPMTVSYLIGDTWHEVMAMPTYVWDALRLKLAEMAGVTLASPSKRQSATIRFLHRGKTRHLAIAFNLKSMRVKMSRARMDGSY
jgi:hypothetical protein